MISVLFSYLIEFFREFLGVMFIWVYYYCVFGVFEVSDGDIVKCFYIKDGNVIYVSLID